MEHEELCKNWQHFIRNVDNPKTPCVCAHIRETRHN